MSYVNNFRRPTALVPALITLISLVPAIVHGQAAASIAAKPPARPAAIQQPPAVTLSSKSALSTEGAMLDTDPRLKQKVTLRLDNVSLSKALAQMSAKTGVSLLADGDQLQTKRISAAFTDKPLRDVLDALASLGDFEWIGRKSGAFVLRAVPALVVNPQVEKYGSQVKGYFDKMTPQQKEALAQPYATPLTALPPDMQAAILGTITSLPEPTASFGLGAYAGPVPTLADIANNPSHLSVGLKVDHQADGDNYYLYYAGANGSGGSVLIDHK